jgi:hypothetical protein
MRMWPRGHLAQALGTMHTRELAQRLFEEGCNPSLYAIGSRGAASDAFCLTHNGTQWQVYYTERGQDSPPIYASGSEAQACEFFFKHIMAMRHSHCVGFFKSEQGAEALKSRLSAVGVPSWGDRIPFGGPKDPRYRVFVAGKAIFPAKAALGSVPVRDNGA